MQLNSHQFQPMYDLLGIDVKDLGCVMLDVEMPEEALALKQEIRHLYSAKDPKKFWIRGFVADRNPHVTLLYGLLKPAYGEYRAHVDYVLAGWKKEDVTVESIGTFDTPFEDEPYFCVVAKVAQAASLKDAFDRLSLIPHVNTNAQWKPHVTICYIDKAKGKEYRDEVVAQVAKALVGKTLKAGSINYGKKK
jgi:2'-5' RNA ligase